MGTTGLSDSQSLFGRPTGARIKGSVAAAPRAAVLNAPLSPRWSRVRGGSLLQGMTEIRDAEIVGRVGNRDGVPPSLSQPTRRFRRIVSSRAARERENDLDVF